MHCFVDSGKGTMLGECLLMPSTSKHQQAPDYYATSDRRTKLLDILKG